MQLGSQQPNFKGNLRDYEEYSTRSKSKKQKDLSPGKFTNSEKRRKKNRVEFGNIQNVPYQVSEEIEESKYRLDQVQKEFAQMESFIATLFERVIVPKFRSEEVDELTETIISVQEQAKRFQERLNLPVMNLKKIEAELAEKIANQADRPTNNSFRESVFGNGNQAKPYAEAFMQLKSLQDRLNNLEQLMK